MLARGPHEMALFEKLDAEPGAWFEPTTIGEVPPWMRWREADLRAALEEGAKHKVDIEAEIAALTGTVMHHHHAPPESAAKTERRMSVKAPAVPRAVPSVSALTTTTTKSAGGMDDDDDEVGMVDNDEEEEVLEQNLATDDTGWTATATEGGAVSGASGGSGLQHIQSTAAMRKVPSGAVGSPGGGADKRPAEGAPEEGEEAAAPEAKRKRTLSVHFEGVDDDEGMPPPPPPANGGAST